MGASKGRSKSSSISTDSADEKNPSDAGARGNTVGRRKLSAEIRGEEIEVERGHTSVGAESKVPSPSKCHRPIIRAFAVPVSGVGRSPDAPEGPQDAVATTEADP